MIAILPRPTEPQPFLPPIHNPIPNLDTQHSTTSDIVVEDPTLANPTLLIGCCHFRNIEVPLQCTHIHTHRTLGNIIPTVPRDEDETPMLESSFEALFELFLDDHRGNLNVVVVGHEDCAVIKRAHTVANAKPRTIKSLATCYGTHPPPHLDHVLGPIIQDAIDNGRNPEALAASNVQAQVVAISKATALQPTPRPTEAETVKYTVTIKGLLLTKNGIVELNSKVVDRWF
ncbi:hypothetical protein QCA50_021179 [Cerrena zonata]|uniref:Carbonic anhydrase n=1 Tax=Cerrena zonata TaxID=2478898 RepID=A0AAW0FAS9_9APHY